MSRASAIYASHNQHPITIDITMQMRIQVCKRTHLLRKNRYRNNTITIHPSTHR